MTSILLAALAVAAALAASGWLLERRLARGVAYRAETLAPHRLLTIDLMSLWAGRPVIHGLVEIDVTRARQLAGEHRERTGEGLSLTALVIAATARAVAEDKAALNAIRVGRRRIVYDRLDVGTMVERRVGGHAAVAPLSVRDADRKGWLEIGREIRAAQEKTIEGVGDLAGMRWIVAVPPFLRRLLWRAIGASPALRGRTGGVVGVSAVGMFLGAGGWGVPVSPSTVMVTVGGIAVRPVLADGQWQPREHLCLTLSFDHDLVDGAPAARFAKRLADLVGEPGLLGAPAADAAKATA